MAANVSANVYFHFFIRCAPWICDQTKTKQKKKLHTCVALATRDRHGAHNTFNIKIYANQDLFLYQQQSTAAVTVRFHLIYKTFMREYRASIGRYVCLWLRFALIHIVHPIVCSVVSAHATFARDKWNQIKSPHSAWPDISWWKQIASATEIWSHLRQRLECDTFVCSSICLCGIDTIRH